MNDESTPKGAHEIPATVSTSSLPTHPALVMHPVDVAWLDALGSGMEIGDSLGHRRGHIEGYDLGYAEGHRAALAEVDAEHSAELDRHGRWIARVIPQAVEARARRAAVSA